MIEAPSGPTVNLTEQEAVSRAQERNLTIISERITPQTWDREKAGIKFKREALS